MVFLKELKKMILKKINRQLKNAYKITHHARRQATANYTMHNKFSNCLVWVSPSTSDLEFHLQSWRYKRRSSDKIFLLKKYRITKRSGRAKVTLNVKTSG